MSDLHAFLYQHEAGYHTRTKMLPDSEVYESEVTVIIESASEAVLHGLIFWAENPPHDVQRYVDYAASTGLRCVEKKLRLPRE